MIRPSPELIAIVRRWNDAVIRRDGETLRNLLSGSEELRYVGSDENEMWSGQILRDGIADHFREIPEFEQGPDTVEAFENGDTGWALWVGKFTFPGTTNVTATHRITFVFALQAGAWKIVHIHISNPMSNVEKMGVEHSALDALVAAARDGFTHTTRSGTASVMFTDIAESSALADRMGDRAWARIVQTHLDMVRKEITANGGTLVKSLGDGTMSTFSSPSQAAETALAIQRKMAEPSDASDLGLRIGIHTGDVIQSGDDFFGTVVNKAARITTLAQPGEIRVSDEIRVAVAGKNQFLFADPVIVPLRGLAGDHLIYRLGT